MLAGGKQGSAAWCLPESVRYPLPAAKCSGKIPFPTMAEESVRSPCTQKGNPIMPDFHHAMVANQPFSVVEMGISDILRSLLVADQLTLMSVIHPCDQASQHSLKKTHLGAPAGRSSTAPGPGHCSWHPSWHRDSQLCSYLELHNAHMCWQ